MNSIIDYLEHWVAIHPDKCFSSFLNLNGKEIETYTYADFHERSCYLAEYLSQSVRLKRGDRVLLIYPPGLENIVAFIACARIGVIPVPVYPPTPTNFNQALSKLAFVAHDCDANVALTTCELFRSYGNLSEERPNFPHLESMQVLPKLTWVTTDDVRGQKSSRFINSPGSILFLQYTSGSTGKPKGVIVSHENVIHNCPVRSDDIPTGVCWLPQYHDMGLIGYYVYLIITGGTTYGFSPMDFLKRPVLWLQTLSRFRATHTSSPNFGFDYCLQEGKITSDQLEGLDLSSVRVMMNGAEPVRAETHRRFLERFGPYGLRPAALVAVYGLAENTLAATNYGRRTVMVNKRLLQEGTLRIENAESLNNDQLTLVSCGRPLEGVYLRIVDPKSCAVLSDGQIGEIWLAGKSVSQGYWNRPELTQEVFRNVIANDPDGHNTYLRTGDLGCLEAGELFICGRLKDIIIIRGVNYYPQDIESIVESASQQIRAGDVVAFSGHEEDGEETLVILVGTRSAKNLPDPAKISHVIRTQYYTGPHTIAFVPPRIIVKTTSGKIARSLIRQRWLNGEVSAIATYVSGYNNALPQTLPSGLMERFQHILRPYNLTGQETYTLAEVGIDSLAMTMLLLEIEQALKEHGGIKIVDVLNGRLLQRLTVAKLFSLLNQLEKGLDAPVADLYLILKQLKQENDDYEASCMQRDAQLGFINSASLVENNQPLTSVLLTGAMGFFGPFLLSSLLLQTPYRYYVLIRAADQISGKARIDDALRNAGLWTPALKFALETRVQVVCGDISQHNLGMSVELYNLLTTKVQAVIHNAALVNYILNYDALRPHNVEGTRELLRFSCTGIQKVFHFISSTIIFGWTMKGKLLESDNNDDMLNLDFGYAQTKWVAEQLTFAAEKQGLKVRVYRPSFISASTNGIASKDDIIIRLLSFMINHGIAVNAPNQISFLPADITANNIVAIFKQQQTMERTFHVTVDDYYNFVDITHLITEEYGYQFVYYDIPTFVAEITRRCAKDDPLYPLLDFFKRSHMRITAMQHKRYANDRYREIRQRSNNSYPHPNLQQTVSYLMSYMLYEGCIAPNPQMVGKLRNV